ncbi:MAG: ABC transporter permease [Gammaproteobacteria bacterium]
MLAFLIRRVALGFLIVVLALTVLIAMIHMVPGDPANVLLGPRATPEMKATLRAEMGLDKPLPVQLFVFTANVFRGDLGMDVFSRRPVATIVFEQLPYTIALVLASIFIAALIGIPLGCYAALHRDSWFDRLSGLFSVSFIAAPSFVVAIYAVLIFAVTLKWLPAVGAGETGDLKSQLVHLVLPAISIGLAWIGYLARLVRASMLEVLGENHIRTMRAFGLPEHRVVFRYALPVAVLPAVTVIGVGIGYLLSSAVLTEIVFARPGIGKLVYDSVVTRNYPVVMGCVLVTTVLFVISTTVADVVNGLLDPRVREGL